MLNNLRYLLISILLSLLMLSCGGKQGKTGNLDFSNRKINIVTTTGMVGDAVKNIAGDRAEVISLMGPGVDPHLYKASEGDVRKMTKADMIFYNGLHLEGKMTEIFKQMSKNRTTVALGEYLPEEELIGKDGAHDPHIWFSVPLWIKVVQQIEITLSEKDSLHAGEYEQNLDDYISRLEELDKYIHAQIGLIPQNQRVLITAHDAFSYFGKAYGIDVEGLQGISTVTEAGTSDVQKLAGLIVSRKIPAIFVESSVPVRNIEAVKAAVKARDFNIEVGGELFSDAMGNPGTAEGEYLGMVKHNVDTIVNALK